MNENIEIVALRSSAIYIKNASLQPKEMTASTAECMKQLIEIGYTLSEDALRAFNNLEPGEQGQYLMIINDVYNTHMNWTPLVRGWLEPTGEGRLDHLLTMFANLPGISANGTRLPCGHLIPNGTFPIERYNGCPFCGMPFRTSGYVFKGQGTKLKTLSLWQEADAKAYLAGLLSSNAPLDATMRDSLKLLLKELGLPKDVAIPIKENAIFVADYLYDEGRLDELAEIIGKSPNDVLRYIWYNITGQYKIIPPKVLIRLAKHNSRHLCPALDQSLEAGADMKDLLKLYFTRKECRQFATILNKLQLPAKAAAAAMHPKCGMWTRLIRALRLAEYAKKPGFESLAELLDTFCNRKYKVPEGIIDKAISDDDAELALTTLKKNPGIFSRRLFSTMLKLGPERTLDAFRPVAFDNPLRLTISLANRAEDYFTNYSIRYARVITGRIAAFPPNKNLQNYTLEECQAMCDNINKLVLEAFRDAYARVPEPGKKVYISPDLFNIAFPIGDRSETIQDASYALPGMRFDVEGDKVRLFLMWGKGMHAAPIDLDISAIVYYPDRTENCAYYSLVIPGLKHSGDIRSIPEMVGTVEYIEIDVNELREKGALYVAFCANSYSIGPLGANAYCGWMMSKNKMTVSEIDGVAYDPSTVQHMVRIPDENITKGVMFGVLDVAANQVIWLEMPLNEQVAALTPSEQIPHYLKQISLKLTIGAMLQMMGQARGWEIVDSPALADECLDSKSLANLPKLLALLLPS